MRLLLLLPLLAACPPPAEAPPEELTEWAGPEPHVIIQGTLDGEDLDLRLEGEDAADAASVFCIREYSAPDDGSGNPDTARATLFEWKVDAPFTVEGQERTVELEFKQHDFQGDDDGEETAIIPRDDANPPPADQMWLELEWHLAADDSDLFESAASEGSFVLGTFTGEPADGNVIAEGDGVAGGFASAKWSAGEELAISATAPCTQNNVEIQE